MANPLPPLKFEPLFKSMLWGGRRLRPLFGHAPGDEPTGEAWVLSDVDGSPSRVAAGPLAGRTLRDLLKEFPQRILGDAKLIDGRFPLLLKFIDAKLELSVQVHPTDAQAKEKHPTANGKTEAWVILDANPATSKIYAGFAQGVTADDFRAAMIAKTTPTTLHQFTPRPGDCVFLEAGTVHAIGADILLFEVQQTSDITYRLYDWDRIDAKTGKGRDLHVEDGLACSNFALGPCRPMTPRQDGHREKLVDCSYFTLHQQSVDEPTVVGWAGRCTAVVCISGEGTLAGEPLRTGDVVLLPAEAGVAEVVPAGAMMLLECGLGG